MIQFKLDSNVQKIKLIMCPKLYFHFWIVLKFWRVNLFCAIDHYDAFDRPCVFMNIRDY